MQDESKSGGASAKQPPKKKWIVAGVVAVVLVVACGGMWIWHGQPSFCAAICHTPMDPYLATYEAQPGTVASDKYGEQVENASGMLSATHRVDANAGCMDCHVPTLSEQVSEGMAWVSGNYTLEANNTYGGVLSERSDAQLTAARGTDGDAFCLKSGCHVNADGSVMTRDDLAKLTSDMTLNPHQVEHGEMACTDCYKAHRASVNQCSRCHLEAEIPEGWVRATE